MCIRDSLTIMPVEHTAPVARGIPRAECLMLADQDPARLIGHHLDADRDQHELVEYIKHRHRHRQILSLIHI